MFLWLLVPRTIIENVNGFNFRFIHYSIPLNKQDRHISKDPFAAIVEPNLENMEKLFNVNLEKEAYDKSDFLASYHDLQ
ncbi:hypothetical protein R0K20_21430, partial [Staphylococcus sp. SIMBA_130]